MDIKIQKKKEKPLSARHTTPIHDDMKNEMKEFSETELVDWNEMIRGFVTSALDQLKKARQERAA